MTPAQSGTRYSRNSWTKRNRLVLQCGLYLCDDLRHQFANDAADDVLQRGGIDGGSGRAAGGCRGFRCQFFFGRSTHHRHGCFNEWIAFTWGYFCDNFLVCGGGLCIRC